VKWGISQVQSHLDVKTARGIPAPFSIAFATDHELVADCPRKAESEDRVVAASISSGQH
jgi:hypothetical protein